jgi:hypothetical protein
VNDSEPVKHVFCLVNSKKRHIGALAKSWLESRLGSEVVAMLRPNSHQGLRSYGRAVHFDSFCPASIQKMVEKSSRYELPYSYS